MSLRLSNLSSHSLLKMGWVKRQKEAVGIGPEERTVEGKRAFLCCCSLFVLLLLGGMQPLAADILYSVTDLGTLGGISSYGTAINNAGQVTGYSEISGTFPTATHAFLYRNEHMTDLGTLPGYASSTGIGLNDTGQVLGTASQSNGSSRAFLDSNGQITALDVPAYATVSGMNNAGQVVGTLYAGHAFLYSQGQLQDLGTLGGFSSFGYAVNNKGQVTGQANISSQTITIHAFLYSNGQMSDLGTLGGLGSIGFGLNDAGQVTGWAEVSRSTADRHAFLYHNGQMQDLGTLGGGSSEGHAVNNLGQVVGVSDTAGFGPRAFLYSNNQMLNLDGLIDPALRLTLLNATAINDRGQIVVNGISPSSIGTSTHTFLLTPVPEPSTLILAGVALFGCGLMVRVRRT